MVAKEIELASRLWPSIAPIVFVPRSQQEYDRLVAVLDTLVDMVGEDDQHPLASLMDVVGTLIEKYEDEYVPELAGGPVAVWTIDETADSQLYPMPRDGMTAAEAEQLIRDFIVVDDNGPAEARVRPTLVQVWPLIGYLRVVGGDIEKVANNYDLPLASIRAAIAYYNQQRAFIDARILLNSW